MVASSACVKSAAFDSATANSRVAVSALCSVARHKTCASSYQARVLSNSFCKETTRCSNSALAVLFAETSSRTTSNFALVSLSLVFEASKSSTARDALVSKSDTRVSARLSAASTSARARVSAAAAKDSAATAAAFAVAAFFSASASFDATRWCALARVSAASAAALAAVSLASASSVTRNAISARAAFCLDEEALPASTARLSAASALVSASRVCCVAASRAFSCADASRAVARSAASPVVTRLSTSASASWALSFQTVFSPIAL